MILRAPRTGTLEWPGDGRPLAWLAVADHCALLPIECPPGAVVTWRRDAALTAIDEGEPLALVGDDAGERAVCEAAQRDAVLRLLRELESLPGDGHTVLQRTLLANERRVLRAQLEQLAHKEKPPST